MAQPLLPCGASIHADMEDTFTLVSDHHTRFEMDRVTLPRFSTCSARARGTNECGRLMP